MAMELTTLSLAKEQAEQRCNELERTLANNKQASITAAGEVEMQVAQSQRSLTGMLRLAEQQVIATENDASLLKNDDFLLKNDDFLSKNDDFLRQAESATAQAQMKVEWVEKQRAELSEREKEIDHSGKNIDFVLKCLYLLLKCLDFVPIMFDFVLKMFDFAEREHKSALDQREKDIGDADGKLREREWAVGSKTVEHERRLGEQVRFTCGFRAVFVCADDNEPSRRRSRWR